MTTLWPIAFSRIPLVLAVLVVGVHPAAAATPSFTVAATNVVLPASGGGSSSQVTLTSVDGYSGSIWVNCQYAGPPTSALLPECGIFGPALRAFQLASDQTLVVGLSVLPYGTPVPVQLPDAPHGKSHASLAGMAFAAACTFGLWRRRSTARRFFLLIFAAMSVLAISSCSTPNSGLLHGTQGTYTYSVTAVDTSTNVTVGTTFLITVP